MSLLRFGSIHCVPIFHNRIQFAREVRRAFAELKPDIVALELPDIYYSDLLQGIERLPRLSLLCLRQNTSNLTYIPVFPSDALIEGLRLARENRLPAALIDLAVQDYADPLVHPPPLPVPDEEAINSLGLEGFYKAVRHHLPHPGQLSVPDQRREAHMAARLNDLQQRFERILFVCGMSHWQGVRKHLADGTGELGEHTLESVDAPFLAKIGHKARPALLDEMPYLVLRYELARRFGLDYQRDALLRKLLQDARNAPALKEEAYSPRELRNILQYAYKLAVSDKRVSPDLYNLLLACKQTLGDDYAIEVLDRARDYPYSDPDKLPEIEFDPNEGFWLGGRKITLQRRLPLPLDADSPRSWEQLKITRKKREELPKGSMALWFFFGFYSHVPEDLILEGFIDRLGDKLASEAAFTDVKTQPFSGSLLDGIDMRETIRNHHLGKIYVREQIRRMAPIGTWVLIFDEDLSQARYPWAMSLSAEHHNESDIAFYASNPALHPVTRDIIRAQYGALLAFKPALPLAHKLDGEDLMVDEQLRKEHLLRLAIQYSPQPGILYFAREAPEPYQFERAKAEGKQLYHLPLSRVSERQLKRIQRFHLLSHRDIRKIADDYI